MCKGNRWNIIYKMGKLDNLNYKIIFIEIKWGSLSYLMSTNNYT